MQGNEGPTEESAQNANIYSAEEDVYLNGDGFAPGTHYYRVIGPGGEVLYGGGYRVHTIDDRAEFTGLSWWRCLVGSICPVQKPCSPRQGRIPRNC